MSKYGKAAVKAVKLLISEEVDNPRDAWEIATSEIFGKGTSSQLKGCPRNAFLGLCEEGMIIGVPPGNYIKSKRERNKEYAVKAVKILQRTLELALNPKTLWNKVLSGERKVHNQQMDVLVSLWINNLIVT